MDPLQKLNLLVLFWGKISEGFTHSAVKLFKSSQLLVPFFSFFFY